MEIKTTYENCKMLIEAQRFTSDDIGILSLFLMVGAIDNDQYVELTGMLAPQKAKPETSRAKATTVGSNSPATAPTQPADTTNGSNITNSTTTTTNQVTDSGNA